MYLDLQRAALALALLAGACSPADAPREPGAEAPGATGAPARRVLAANAGALDLVVALGEPEQLAGAVRSTLPWSAAMRRRAARLEDRQVLAAFDVEEIVALAPDLIVAHAWQTQEKAAQLERLGVPLLLLAESAGLAPEAAWSAILDDVRRVGEALGRPDAAAALAADLVRRRAALGRVDRSDVRVLTYSDGGGGGWTAGAGTTYAALVTWTGAVPAAARAGIDGHARLDLERLLALDPEVLVVPAANEDGGTSATLALLQGDERTQGLTAFRAGTVVVLPAYLFSTTSQYALEAAEVVAAGIDAWRAGEAR